MLNRIHRNILRLYLKSYSFDKIHFFAHIKKIYIPDRNIKKEKDYIQILLHRLIMILMPLFAFLYICQLK